MTEQMEIAVIAATGQIVAQLAKQYSESQVISLIADVRKALTATLIEPKPEPVDLAPAVPVRKSVTPDAIICLEDGKAFKSVKRHLSSHYGMTPEQYRAKWNLPADYPMVAPNYSATRSKLAKENGLGRK